MNISVSIRLTTLAYMLLGYQICLNTKNIWFSTCKILDIGYAPPNWTVVVTCYPHTVLYLSTQWITEEQSAHKHVKMLILQWQAEPTLAPCIGEGNIKYIEGFLLIINKLPSYIKLQVLVETYKCHTICKSL